MHILVYASVFPTPRDPNHGIFTAQIAASLARKARVSVVAPLPWFPDAPVFRRFASHRLFAGIPAAARHGELPVFYPRYPLLPKVSGAVHTLLQALGAAPLVHRLHAGSDRFDAVSAHWVYPDGVVATWLARRLVVPV